jgi:tRNA dimethylallyltransferase
MGLSPLFNALNTVGYREAFAFLHGEIDREEMIRLFQRNSRRYAKRQMTWFRRDARITWIPMDGLTTPEAAADLIAHDFTACAIDERGPIPSGDPS